ncbi:U3 small nucleolar RNA-associated protein 6 [Dillenia turbinata]|uniref:U3 small nucleolar RNA-associated protein 6 n=1 Tax=Dillenia turbinata TaxID=194707 RepID=A0AAN8VEU6_9MAGN
MADVVQCRLERMVNELDDLEKKGLFTRHEIAEIKQVDALQFLRRKTVSKKLNEQGNKRLKKSMSDYAAVSRIIELCRLATNRYKGDIDLWFQYLEYCRQKKWQDEEAILVVTYLLCDVVNWLVIFLHSALASVIRFHPKVPGVWIYAAAWEFDLNLNVAAARALMQNGLRVCPTSEDFWVEYLRMELTHLNKLKARKSALGEDVKPLIRDKGDAKQWKDENKDLFMSLSNETENNHDSLQDGESEENLDVLREQGLIILQTIYEGAVEALPTSLSLRKRFYNIVEATDLENSEDMKKEILDAQSSGPNDTPYLLEVYEKAEKMGCLDEELAQQHIFLYLQQAQIWNLRLSIEIRHIASSNSSLGNDLHAVFELLRNLLTKLTVSKAESLWLMAQKFFVSHRDYFNKLVQISQMSSVKEVGGDYGFSLSSAIVKFVIQKDGIDRAREMYKQFLKLPHPGISLYKTCIELEENLASTGDKDSLKNARTLYETELASYNHDVSLWHSYYAMEIKMGTSETAKCSVLAGKEGLKGCHCSCICS